MTTSRTPITICWHCDRPLDAATELMDEGKTPTPGAVSLCLYCGAIGYFADDLALRAPTDDELTALREDADFRQQWAMFMWARNHVMLRENLLRDRTDPDR